MTLSKRLLCVASFVPEGSFIADVGSDHENLGYGTLGFAVLSSIAWDPRLRSVPKILETPTDGIHDPYPQEIAMLRHDKFIENWREKL